MGEEDVAYIFPGDSVVKNLPANAGDTGDVDLVPGSAYPLKEEKATHSSTLAWRIPWMEEPGGLQYVKSRHSQTRRSPEQQLVDHLQPPLRDKPMISVIGEGDAE